jgi:hypothetical protein
MIEQKNFRRVGGQIRAVVPDVGDDQGALARGKIDPDRAGGRVGRVKTHLHPDRGRLPRGRIGPFARRHGHHLHAHDHEAVIEDRAHQDQEQRQNDGKLKERLALAFAPDFPQRGEWMRPPHFIWSAVVSLGSSE